MCFEAWEPSVYLKVTELSFNLHDLFLTVFIHPVLALDGKDVLVEAPMYS